MMIRASYNGPPWLFWTAFCFAIVYLVLAFGTRNYLKTHHAATWQKLGQPSLSNHSIKNSLRYLKFFLLSEYLILNDKKLNLVFLIMRVLFVVYLFLFL